ncbi:MAG: GNAT family N-acetyltransferase [Burkholderiales bacterium]|nr:GNAT family N-acetyltransferase [Burkholderiales bacterium]
MPTRPQNVSLRLARPGDAGVVAALSRDLIESGLGWSWSPERVARAMRDRNTVTLIASERGKLVAFGIMYFGDEHAHLSLLAVRPSHQRQGVGRRMLEWLLQSALTAGIASIHLELRAANHGARRFYRALGFVETAYIPGYYQGKEMALRMMRELRDPRARLPDWRLPSPKSS